MSLTDYKYEKRFWENGKVPAGVDEAGRGPLAGPVVAACVVLLPTIRLEGLNDSKALTPLKREKLFEQINNYSEFCSIGIVENDEIDRINILKASIKAMELAILGLEFKPDMVYIDGNIPTNLEINQATIVKGDQKCRSIAAASIVAKVTRDSIMKNLHNQYPQYNFDKHKGYPTKEHYEAIKKYGPCPIHRLSYKGVTNY